MRFTPLGFERGQHGKSHIKNMICLLLLLIRSQVGTKLPVPTKDKHNVMRFTLLGIEWSQRRKPQLKNNDLSIIFPNWVLSVAQNGNSKEELE